jgi:hypothetical protein
LANVVSAAAWACGIKTSHNLYYVKCELYRWIEPAPFQRKILSMPSDEVIFPDTAASQRCKTVSPAATGLSAFA